MSWHLITQDFTPNFDGGIASWMSDLAHCIAETGERVTVYARSGANTAAHDDALPFAVVRVRGRSWGAWQGVWTGLSAGPRLRRGDRVIAATWRTATVIAQACALTGARLGVGFHGSDITRLRTAPPALQKIARTAALLPVSAFLARELARLSLPSDNVHVLPMPIAAPDVPPLPHGQRSGLVMVSRLTHLKGTSRAISLAQAVGLPLTVVGEGPARAGLEGAHTRDSVRFVGRLPRDAAMAHLARARACVLLPTVDTDGTGAEGFGLCLLEAALRGTPAIGNTTGGVPEATGPGLILSDSDTPDIPAVRTLLADPAAGIRAHRWARTAHGPAAARAVLRAALA